MLENNCEGEGKLGEEDMAVGFVCTERTTRRSKELHVRFEVLFSTMLAHGRRSTSNESLKRY